MDRQGDVYEKLRSSLPLLVWELKQGIDLPGEATGISTSIENMDPVSDGGKILDLAFGQFDTYTTLQLAQYAATVANGGKRLQPHIVDGIYDNDETGGLGSLIEEHRTNGIERGWFIRCANANYPKWFYDAVHGTDAWATAKGLASAKMEVSAKTGTAETPIVDSNGNTINS